MPDLKKVLRKNLEYLNLNITETPCKPTLKSTDERRLKYAFMFSFPNNITLNPNASLILVKTLQYLDSNDMNNKEEIMSLLSRSCFEHPMFSGNVLSQNFFQEIILGNHKVLFVYYQLLETPKTVAFTEASYLKKHSKEFYKKKNVKKIYYGQYNLACVTFNNPILAPIIQPLTENQICKLNEIYGTIILVNPSQLEISSNYYFSPEFSGVICIASEDGKKGLSLRRLLKINKKMMEK